MNSIEVEAARQRYYNVSALTREASALVTNIGGVFLAAFAILAIVGAVAFWIAPVLLLTGIGVLKVINFRSDAAWRDYQRADRNYRASMYA